MGQASVIHIHGLWEEVQCRAARVAQAHRKPYLIRPCGMLDPWSLAQGRWKKSLYLRLRLRSVLDGAAAIHFTTHTEGELTRPLRLRAPALVEPNGLSLEEYASLPPPGTFRLRHGIHPGRLLLLFLSRLHPKKGLDLLLPAFARLVGDSLLVIAGPDQNDYRATLAAEVARLGLDGRVLFTGMLQGVEKLAALADADLFVLPSYQENFGVAVIEALAAGTPVVLSDQVNIHAEVYAAGVGGVVPTRVEPLAAELQRWLDSGELRRAASSRAVPFVRERFGWDRIAQRWAGHYGRLAASEPARR